MITEIITPARLAELIRYDEATGFMYWKPRTLADFASSYSPEASLASFAAQREGQRALCAVSEGYQYGQINGKKIRANRAAYCLHYGRWPVGIVDHIDRDRGNNRISNLRDSTHAENSRNRKVSTNNTSGVRGVSKLNSGRWLARISYNGKRIRLGCFKDKSDAIEARRAAELNLGGYGK